jgi:flagellar basal-body rod protein FlgB
MSPVDSTSVIDRLSAAMSLSNLQHQVIASNIANRDTPGYQRMRLSFEQALDRAGEASVTPDLTPTSSLSLEQDMIDLSVNGGRYQSLARVLNRYFSIISTITSPSRG